MKCDLNKLRELCSNNQNIEVINKIIESLHNRQDYTAYHYREYRRITLTIEKFSDALNKEKDTSLKANIVACMQNMHVVHDLLGNLIYSVLNLDVKKKNFYFRDVIDKLSNENNPKYKQLVILLIKLAGETKENQHPFFQYLEDSVNHSKHRYTIEPKFKTHFVGNIERECYFETFKKNEIEYPLTNADFFINTEYNRESKLIIQIENELIAILEAQN